MIIFEILIKKGLKIPSDCNCRSSSSRLNNTRTLGALWAPYLDYLHYFNYLAKVMAMTLLLNITEQNTILFFM
jgi:hypothetical protein